MTASARLVDYIGRGLAANLPAPGSITYAPNTAALYYATDTGALYLLNGAGSAWIQFPQYTNAEAVAAMSAALVNGTAISITTSGGNITISVVISTDGTLGGTGASDTVIPSQKAIKTYVDAHGGGGSLTVTDGATTETAVTALTFSGAAVSTTGAGEATVTITGGGGGVGVPTVVQQVFTHIQGSNQPVTLPSAPTPGNTIVAIICGAGDTNPANVPNHGADWNIISWVNNGPSAGSPGYGPSFQSFSVAAKAVASGDPSTYSYTSTNGANVYLIEFAGRVGVESSGVSALSTATGALVQSPVGGALAAGLRLAVFECDGENTFTFADTAITKLYDSGSSAHYGCVGKLPSGYSKPIVVNYASAPNYPLGAVVSVASV